jgi:hypothetical protein
MSSAVSVETTMRHAPRSRAVPCSVTWNARMPTVPSGCPDTTTDTNFDPNCPDLLNRDATRFGCARWSLGSGSPSQRQP